MKITKRQLKRIIKEEKAKLFCESFSPMKSRATVHTRVALHEADVDSIESLQSELLDKLTEIIKGVAGVEKSIYGLVDPDDGTYMGDTYGEELDAYVQDLREFEMDLFRHFNLLEDLKNVNPGRSIG